MTQSQAIEFLQAIRATNIKVKNNGWLIASCPLARWLHANENDVTPSFGLTVIAGESSSFHCFACRSGTAELLLQTIEFYVKGQMKLGYNFAQAHALLAGEEIAAKVLDEYEEAKKQTEQVETWPMYWLDSFKPVEYVDEAWQYLKSRNVPEATIKKHSLRFDSTRKMIVCPYFNVFNHLAGARGRSILPGTTGIHKHYDYSFKGMNNARLVWYNEPVLNLDGPAIAVEGQFDCWRVEEVWPKVVANLTAKPTLRKMQTLASADSGTTIHIPDRDVTGEASVALFQEMANAWKFKLVTLALPEGVKDPDDCSSQYLLDRIHQTLAV